MNYYYRPPVGAAGRARALAISVRAAGPARRAHRVGDGPAVAGRPPVSATCFNLRDTYPGPRLAVTENGAAFTDLADRRRVADDRRITYLTEHLKAPAPAMADGVDVFAYFVWSAFDNMEWHDGYGPRFGVIHVDYDTMARTPKDSALGYARSSTPAALPLTPADQRGWPSS